MSDLPDLIEHNTRTTTEHNTRTTTEHNTRALGKGAIRAAREFGVAGVACPIRVEGSRRPARSPCGTEMFYADNLIIYSNPPHRAVICPKCGHCGIKVVLS